MKLPDRCPTCGSEWDLKAPDGYTCDGRHGGRTHHIPRADLEAWRGEDPPPAPGAARASSQDKPAATVTASSTPTVIRLDGVQPETVRWLWPGRVPMGKLTVLDGDPGLGKSTLTLDVAARVSTGQAMPDGTYGDVDAPADVLLLSAEDGLGDTIVPRLRAAGADLSRCEALAEITDPPRAGRDGQPVAQPPRPPSLPQDVDVLAEVIREAGAKLVIVDPLMAFLGGGVDSHRDQDIRAALAPLAGMADETGAAVVIIRHLNKTPGSNPLYRGGGSIGIIGAARAGLLVAPDPQDDTRRVLAVTKSNLAALPPALAYRITPTPDGVAALSWEGATAHTAAQLLEAPVDAEGRSALDEAVDFLRDALADGPQPARDVQRQAREAGIAERTLWRAKARLGVTISRQGEPGKRGGGPVSWQLPLSGGGATNTAGFTPPSVADTGFTLPSQNGHVAPSGGPLPERNGLAAGTSGIYFANPAITQELGRVNPVGRVNPPSPPCARCERPAAGRWNGEPLCYGHHPMGTVAPPVWPEESEAPATNGTVTAPPATYHVGDLVHPSVNGQLAPAPPVEAA